MEENDAGSMGMGAAFVFKTGIRTVAAKTDEAEQKTSVMHTALTADLQHQENHRCQADAVKKENKESMCRNVGTKKPDGKQPRNSRCQESNHKLRKWERARRMKQEFQNAVSACGRYGRNTD